MLRVREEQTSDAYEPRAGRGERCGAAFTRGREGRERAAAAPARDRGGVERVPPDPESAYGAGPAGAPPCPAQSAAAAARGRRARALCCEQDERRQQGDSYYHGASLIGATSWQQGREDGTDATDADRASAPPHPDAAARLFSKAPSRCVCSTTRRGRSAELEIATSALTRPRRATRRASRSKNSSGTWRGYRRRNRRRARRWTRRARRSSRTTRRRAPRRSDLETLETLSIETLRRLRRARRAGRTSFERALVPENATTTHSRTAATAEAGKKSALTRRPPRTESGGVFFGVRWRRRVAACAARRGEDEARRFPGDAVSLGRGTSSSSST